MLASWWVTLLALFQVTVSFPGPFVPQVSGGGTGPSFVQAVSALGSMGTTVSVTITATTGNLLAVETNSTGNNGITLSSCSDGTNTYTVVDNVTGAPMSATSAGDAYAKNITGGSLTVTCTLSGSTIPIILITEVHGASITTPLDGHACHGQNSVGTGTDAATVGPITTTATDLIVATTADGNQGATINAGTGYTLDKAQNSSRIATHKTTNPGAGSITATFTDTNAAADNASCVMAFKS